MRDYGKLAEYVERAKAQEETAYSYLYESTYSIVYNIACTSVKNEEEARDIVSEVYIRAFRNLSSLQDNHSFIRWLVVIAQHVCCDHRTEWNHTPEVLPLLPEVGDEGDPVAEWLEKESKRTLMHDLIRRLPEAQQRAVVYVYFRQLTLGQAAALEGCPINTIKSRLYYARETLRRAILAEERRTGDKYHLPVAAAALASIMALPQVGFTLPPEAAAQIFGVVMSALGVTYAGEKAASFYTVVQEKEEDEGSRLTRLWSRSYLIRLKPAVLLMLTTVVLLSALLFSVIAYARNDQAADSGLPNPPDAPGMAVVTDSDLTDTTAVPEDAQTDTIDGVSYTYIISEGRADIVAAVVQSEITKLVLPKELGGCPVAALTAPFIENSEGITELRIPDTMDVIPAEDAPHAFARMRDLETIFVSGGSKTLCSSKGVLYTADMDTLLIYPQAKPDQYYRVLSQTKTLAPHSMAGRKLLMIDLPEGLVEIGAWCFAGSEELKTLTIPSTVTTLGENALGSPSIEKILVIRGSEHFYSVGGALYDQDKQVLIRYPAGKIQPEVTVRGGTTTIEPYAFYRADNVYMLTLPDSVTEIKPYGISEMNNLEILFLSENIRSLPAYAVANNTAIDAITLPPNLSVLDDRAFDGCASLKEITYAEAPEAKAAMQSSMPQLPAGISEP